MLTGRIQPAKTVLLLMGLVLALAGPVRAASFDYSVTVDTSSLQGTAGNLDFQFNPGTTGAPAAQATLSAFGGNGILQSGAVPTGNVTGSLPGTLSFSNSTVYNDYFQPMVFGASTTFHLHFGGAFTTATSGSDTRFSVSLYDAAGINPLLTVNPDGAVLQFELAPRGMVTPTTFNAALNMPSVASVAVVPLPGAAFFFGSGLLALARTQWRKRGF